MEYTIGEFAKRTKLSAHTLRYYEKEELIIPLRKENGRRVYHARDVEWIMFIKRLKEIGMPIREIKKYALLRAQGNKTLQERKEMLERQRILLIKDMERKTEFLQNLEHKIDYYEKELAKSDE